MKFSIENTELLAGALKRVLPACPGKTTLPILSHVLLEVERGQLRMTATDLEILMSFAIAVDYAENGAVTLPGKMFQELMARLPEETTVTFETDDRHIATITAGACEYTLRGLPAGEFPGTPLLTDVQTLTMKGQTLAEMIKRTRFAISSDETRMILTGARLSWDPSPQPPPRSGEGESAGGLLSLAATDTHRLAVDQRRVTCEGEAFGMIIPGRSLGEMAKAIGKDDAEVTLRFNGAQIELRAGGLTLLSRLIEGQYPEWQRLVREGSATTVTVSPRALQTAIERAGLVARVESNKVILRTEDVRLALSAETEAGTAHERLPASIVGEAVEVGFNAEYLHDVLAAMETEAVMLALDGPKSPGVITGQGIEGYFCLVMPMQTT